MLLTLFTLFAHAQAPPRIDLLATKNMIPAEEAVDLTTWYYDTPIHLELYSNAKPGDRERKLLQWKLPSHSKDQGIAALASAIGSAGGFVYVPAGMKFASRPVAGDSGCNPAGTPTNCQTFEIYPVSLDGEPYQSPLDLPLDLEPGLIGYREIEMAFMQKTGAPVMPNSGFYLAPVQFDSGPITMRQYLNRSLHEGSIKSPRVWFFRGRTPPREGATRVYHLSVMPYEQRWHQGKGLRDMSEFYSGVPVEHP